MNDKTLFDNNLDNHHHLVCTHCKKVEDTYWTDFDKTIRPEPVERMGKVHTRHLELHGICMSCMEQSNEKLHYEIFFHIFKNIFYTSLTTPNNLAHLTLNYP